MEKIKLPVLFTTAYLFFYTLTPFINVPDMLIISMWAISPILVIWMVYRVLKDGKPSGRTFDDYWYDDAELQRVKVKEENGNEKPKLKD